MSRDRVASFNGFASNVNSQFGEDGIIAEILSRIDDHRPLGERYCVEFGAWDGQFLSNTYSLIANKGYKAVLIEADAARFRVLCRNLPQESVTKMNEFVGFEGSATLDKLLARTSIPRKFDLLSIDIDGNDYHVLESLNDYRPILICIEFNPTIPNSVEYVQPRDFRVKRGASARAIASLASRKGYAVVAATQCNLLLLDRGHLSEVGLSAEPALSEIRPDDNVCSFVFCGYDGSVLLSRPVRLAWHGVTVEERDLQVLPAPLRRFSGDYNLFQRVGLQLLRFLRRSRSA